MSKKEERLRVRLKNHASGSDSVYEPKWEGAFRAYTIKYIQLNLWRVRRTCDMDDAMQEARIVFLRCVKQYSGVVDNDAWMMALYKRSLYSRFANLAVADGHYRSVGELMCDVETDDSSVPEAMGETDNAGALNVLVSQAPSEVREVLALLINAPLEVIELATEAWRSRGKKSAFGNAMLCRMLGREQGTDVLQQVRDYLS